MIDKSLILNDIKNHLDIKTNKGFAEFLEIKATTLSMWYKRNTFDIELIFNKCEYLNPEWLLTGKGNMLKTQSFPMKTDKIEDQQMIPLYDLEAVAGVIPVITDIDNQTPIDHIYIPNAPKCDGAMHANGDSMYPLLKSGDILAFKIITDFVNDVFFGEMYILFIEVAGDLFRTVKFVHKGEDKEHIKLVSQNKHHQDKEIHLSKIRAMAQVKASIRIH